MDKNEILLAMKAESVFEQAKKEPNKMLTVKDTETGWVFTVIAYKKENEDE